MAANPNLVLKPVTDKNGVTSSRWVKPVQGGGTAGTIPPVVSKGQIKQTRLSTLGALYGVFGQYVDEDMYSIDDITSTLKNADDKTLNTMLKFVLVDGDDSNYDRVEQAADWIVQYDDRDETLLRELLTYRDVFDEYVDINFVEDAIKRLHKCTDLPAMDDYSDADDATNEHVTSVLRKAENRYAAIYNNGDTPIILGERIHEVIKDNPDRVEEIAAVMKDRDTEDPDLVMSIINAETPALANGVL